MVSLLVFKWIDYPVLLDRQRSNVIFYYYKVIGKEENGSFTLGFLACNRLKHLIFCPGHLGLLSLVSRFSSQTLSSERCLYTYTELANILIQENQFI